MRTFPEALIFDSLQDIRKGQLSAMVPVCPFCGERLKRFDYNHQLVDAHHSPTECTINHVATYFDEGPSYAYAVDPDGDLWLFTPHHDFEDVYWLLTPTNVGDLSALIRAKIQLANNLLALNHNALDLLNKVPHGR